MNININLPRCADFAIKRLLNRGYEAGIVGGCTRDIIMGKTPKDWDICTSASPSEIQNTFSDFKQLCIGIKHGTVTVIIDNEPLEITTFRIDGEYSDGRRPDSVNFTKDLTKDLSRRDYTQNAIFYNYKTGIVDPFNGILDINQRILRCVGNPAIRLKEDSLRILRGLRFAAVQDFQIEENTKKEILKNRHLLKNVSMERISVEFMKTLQGEKCTNILEEFPEVFGEIIPEILPMIGLNQYNQYHIHDVWKHTLVAMDNVDGALLKLTMLFHDIGKPQCFFLDDRGIGHFYGHSDKSFDIASSVFNRLKLSSSNIISTDELKKVLELIKYHDVYVRPEPKSIKKMLSKLHGDYNQFERLLMVKKADTIAHAPCKLDESMSIINKVEELFNEMKNMDLCVSLKDLKVTGKDLINMGIPQGKNIGEILNKLLDLVIEEKIPNKSDILKAEGYSIYLKGVNT